MLITGAFRTQSAEWLSSMRSESIGTYSAGTGDLIACSMVLPTVSHRTNGAANKTVDDPTDPGLGGAA